ncbi:indoleamine 2,3-dioxygenase 2 isoform X2 [Marmota monax]|uniref:indoleamine 2,3-dioxygenase 2 isoform X2 n=1 Tax=Marmota monax TaxID=9995 RepID=UPI001EB05E2C|nr:indoleamine 2,3-dioxygenase 2 isoform X2 [Marmota monax]
MEPQTENLKTAWQLSLGSYYISEEYGFLLPNPLMPLLSCQFLKSYRQQRLAHLVLSSITMGYVWQEGETQPKEVLPRNLAIPFVEVSRNLGLPPILVHSDLVLANWTKRNSEGPLEISNLDTIILFPGGESLRGFILVTVLVEKAAVPGIKALAQAMHAVLQPSQDALLKALQQLKLCIQDMTRTLGRMHGIMPPCF